MSPGISILSAALCVLSAVASAAPCNQPLSGLIGLASSGCTVGDKLFTNFSLTQSGTLAGMARL